MMTTRRTNPPPVRMLDIELDTLRVRDYTVKPSRLRQVLAWLNLDAAQVEGLGGDVSKWQTEVNFTTTQTNGWKFAFMRSTYGLTPDTKFKQHWAGAKGKVLRGLYHYYLNAQDPKQQATAAFNACDGDIGEMPPVLDLEEYGNVDLTESKVQDCLEWLTLLFKKTPIIYTGKSVWDTHFGSDATWGLAYPLWLAQYTLVGWQTDHLNKVVLYPPTPPAPFTKWDFWQFSASCPSVNYGVSGNVVDLNYAAPGVLAKYNIPPDPTPLGALQMEFIIKAPDGVKIRTAPQKVDFPTNQVGLIPNGKTFLAKAMKPYAGGSFWLQLTEPDPAWLTKSAPEYWACMEINAGSVLIDFHASTPCPETDSPDARAGFGLQDVTPPPADFKLREGLPL